MARCAAHAVPMRLQLLVPLLVIGALAAAENRGLNQAIAALSDPRRSVHQEGVRRVASHGEAAVPYLEVLLLDRDDALRARVALALGDIGGPQAHAQLTRLLGDRSLDVQQAAVLAMGHAGQPQAYALLVPVLTSEAPELRETAAIALGVLGDGRAIADLAAWPLAGGERHKLVLEPGPLGERQLRAVQIAMKEALEQLIGPASIPAVIAALQRCHGQSLGALCQATWSLVDPRLCPELTRIAHDADLDARLAAIHALASNGDSRAIATLVAIAETGNDRLGQAAASTLRRLTGHGAAAGKAWTLWWSEHQATVTSLAARDAFLAELYDVARVPTRVELAAFTPEQLMPLVDGAFQRGRHHWPPLALRALRLDDPGRWTKPLFDRYDRGLQLAERVSLVVLLTDLGDPAARQGLADRYDDLLLIRAGKDDGSGSLKLAFEQCLGIVPGSVGGGRLK